MADMGTRRLADYFGAPGIDQPPLTEALIEMGLASAIQGGKADSAMQPSVYDPDSIGGEVAFKAFSMQSSIYDPDDTRADAFQSANAKFTNAIPTTILRSVADRLSEFASVKDFGAVGDGATSDTAAINNSLTNQTGALYLPAGIYSVGTLSSQFNTRQRMGPGIIKTAAGNIYPDSDILRYDPKPDTTTDYSINITQNRSDIQSDPTKRGYYFYNNVVSSRATGGHLFGYAANINRIGGPLKAVGAQLNAYSNNPATDTPAGVWGIATEAWSGSNGTEPLVSAKLIGGEFAVLSQYHLNVSPILGADFVFKNRGDSQPDVLHGSAGSNQFNKNSRAINISTGNNAGRPPSGAYTGWNTGIYFAQNSLDQSVDSKALGIDMSQLDSSRMLASLSLPANVPVELGSPGTGIYDAMKYNTSDRSIQFIRDVRGTPVVRAFIDLNLTGPSGRLVAFGGMATSGTAGSASALPALPAIYFQTRWNNTNYVIPAYLA